MSATELIEQLKALSPKEREKFVRLFRAMDLSTFPSKADLNGESASHFANWANFNERLKRIYGTKVVADSAAVISFSRGDW